MIIARSPLRISLGGGGTDLPSYYHDHEGFLIAGAINKYVYITLHDIFRPGFIIKYSEIENVAEIEQVRHPLIREALKLTATRDWLELTSMADIPAGTGLGSSGSFTTALLKALHAHNKNLISPHALAEQACHIEIELLGEPVGKQDQFIAAYGGLTTFTFRRDGTVEAEPLSLDEETLFNLEDNLLLFFTGYSRSASSILQDQDSRTKQADRSMIDNLHDVKDLGYRSRDALMAGDLHRFGLLLDEHWQNKRRRSAGMSKADIDTWYDLGVQNGAVGGKLIGAGGGGFLMFYAEEKVRLRRAMRGAGLTEVRFRFDFEGSKVITQ